MLVILRFGDGELVPQSARDSEGKATVYCVNKSVLSFQRGFLKVFNVGNLSFPLLQGDDSLVSLFGLRREVCAAT